MSQHVLNIRPARMVMNGEEWVPASYADALADALREKQRTQASHRHQFAEIRDLWANLPHRYAEAPYAKSAEAFRKHGLIATGYCDVETHVFESEADLLRVGPLIKRGADAEHGYSVVTHSGNVLTLYRPHSQSFKAMGKERFYESKRAVLDWGHALLGVK